LYFVFLFAPLLIRGAGKDILQFLCLSSDFGGVFVFRVPFCSAFRELIHQVSYDQGTGWVSRRVFSGRCQNMNLRFLLFEGVNSGQTHVLNHETSPFTSKLIHGAKLRATCDMTFRRKRLNSKTDLENQTDNCQIALHWKNDGIDIFKSSVYWCNQSFFTNWT
jgi:hypothetical protein